jgi:hypothetical protein
LLLSPHGEGLAEHFLSTSQVTPSPLYPSLQAQAKSPGPVLVHLASAEQGFAAQALISVHVVASPTFSKPFLQVQV